MERENCHRVFFLSFFFPLLLYIIFSGTQAPLLALEAMPSRITSLFVSEDRDIEFSIELLRREGSDSQLTTLLLLFVSLHKPSPSHSEILGYGIPQRMVWAMHEPKNRRKRADLSRIRFVPAGGQIRGQCGFLLSNHVQSPILRSKQNVSHH